MVSVVAWLFLGTLRRMLFRNFLRGGVFSVIVKYYVHTRSDLVNVDCLIYSGGPNPTVLMVRCLFNRVCLGKVTFACLVDIRQHGRVGSSSRGSCMACLVLHRC